ncbi:Lrp/AsnC family transcriptional regulator [Candidatus Woesearchaeota archaeon]|nr:Lrp/AsnC family transcriptional regulator [Candidatus Woesearchaeota archaeon]
MISLDKYDKRILFELDQNARIAETQLAKKINRSKESARYRIRQLEKKGIITRYFTWIDPPKLGYQVYKLYLKLVNIPEERNRFYEYVKNEKTLFWLGIGDGVFTTGLTFFSYTNTDFYDFKQRLFSEFKELILTQTAAIVVDAKVYSKNFLAKDKISEYKLFGNPEKNNIDSLDKNILASIFQNSKMSTVNLANKFKVSSDTIRNRIKKIEKLGIVLQYKTEIDFHSLGYEFFKTFIYFKNLTKKEESRFLEFIKQHPNIIHSLRTIAPWDMELEVIVENYNEYNTIINQIEREFASSITHMESTILSEDHIYPSKKIVFSSFGSS